LNNHENFAETRDRLQDGISYGKKQTLTPKIHASGIFQAETRFRWLEISLSFRNSSGENSTDFKDNANRAKNKNGMYSVF
jgi:hypothetical protein